jgi:hypothetical protein
MNFKKITSNIMKKNLVIPIILFTFLLTGCSNGNETGTNQTSTTPQNELSCDEIKKEAQTITSSMNYCESDSDCLIIYGYLFDCYYLANKDADQSLIKNSIKEYTDKKCPNIIFDCYTVNLTAKCKNNKCTTL